MTPQTPITVGHVGWSPDFKTPKIPPATGTLIARRSAAACSAVVGHWTPVTDSMPDDEITVLVWVESLEDATLAYHDSEIKDRRGDSGWIMAGTSRVLLGVTHWCQQINPPND
jgi:hypothetical protein